jgi:hypothetical protein
LAALAGGMLCISTAAAQTGTQAPYNGTDAKSVTPQLGTEVDASAKGDPKVLPGGGEGGASNNECTTAEVIACPTTFMVNLAQSTTNPADPLFSCHFSGPTQGVNSVWYRFTAPGSGEVRIRTCTSAAPADDSLIAVYTGTCTSLVEVCCSEDECGASTFLGDLCCSVIAGQTYTVQLAAWSAGDVGTYTVVFDCACAGACDVVCQPGKLPENEPDCFNEFNDTFNGGCNSTPPVFRDIVCGNQICGSYGTYLFQGGQRRDTDWYRFSIGSAQQVTWSVTGEADTRTFLLTGVCPTTVIVTNLAGPCDPSVVTAPLAAGTYFAFAGTNVFTGVPCGSDYNATLTCALPGVGACCLTGGQGCIDNVSSADCAAQGGFYQGDNTSCANVECCSVVCDPDKIPEGEPNCGLPDFTNGGCNATPPLFFFLNCGDALCGTYAAEGGTRDTDWFNLFTTLPNTGITWSLVGEGPTLGFIIQPGPDPLNPCSGLVILTSGTADPCDPIILNACAATPGEYWTWAGPSVFEGVPCGATYNALLDCGSCPGPCDVVCDPDKTPENEPDCGLPADTTNGGCNSTPEVFSPIACNQAYCGTYAFDGSTRDTDWYQINHPGGELCWNVEGEHLMLVAIIQPGPNGCLDFTIPAISTTPACTPIELCATLPAGIYWLFAGPDFGNPPMPCGAEYNAEAKCGAPCPCEAGDADGDCDVDSTDLNFVLSEFGCTSGCGPGDVDGDGDVDSTDLNFVLSLFGCVG